MRAERIPVALEGVPFIGAAVIASIVFALLEWPVPAVAALAVAAFVLYFFRDPERVVPHGSGLIVSPADGKVIDICEVDRAPLMSGRTVRISIFMNVFNVHVNRSPIAGTVKDMAYQPGTFLPADRDGARMGNEQNALLIEGQDGCCMTVVQVAGLIARRIVCRAEVGDYLRRGERFGMIRFGSRLDCYLPPDCSVKISKGQKTVAGQTVLATWSRKDG